MDSKALSAAVTSFSAKFCNELEKDKSVVSSPLSAEFVLALLALGSTESVHYELLTTLGMPDDDSVRSSFLDVSSKLKSIQGVTLHVANKVYIKEGDYDLNPQLKEDAVKVFDAGFEKLDFSNAVAAANSINKWVESKTNDRIKDLLSADSFNDSTRLVFVNALYFKGTWKDKFNAKLTREQPFHVSEDKTIEAPMMLQRAKYRHGESQKFKAQGSVGERFDMSKGLLFQSFTRVIKALNLIAHEVIKWPTETEQADIKAVFAAFAGLNDVVGAVDGTYVPIKAPKQDAQRYVNRKGVHAVTLQAVAIPPLKFINCFAGYPSSVGDRRIFENSDLYKSITSQTDAYFHNNAYIIGDKAYPVLNWCIAPYIDRGNLQVYQKNFNTIHAKTRQVVERSFALLFGRFRRLKYLDMNRVDLIPFTIIACCVLHNLCLGHDLNIEEYIDEGMPHLHNQDNSVTHEANVDSAHRRRDEIAIALLAQRT